MKKIIIFIVFVLSLILIYTYNKPVKDEPIVKTNKEEVKAIFISYIDYQDFGNMNDEEIKKEIDKMISNVKTFGLDTIILQVISFADSIYNSKIYPAHFSNKFDILDYFIKESENSNIKIYAWVNPYRISNIADKNNINKDSYYYSWIDTNNIEVTNNGIYFNPASSEVSEYLISGIKELVKNYDIDGLLYDDYFYPNNDIDKENYDEYQKEGGSLSIEEYRINNINNLIKDTYQAIKVIKSNVLFGISPSGNVENNLNDEYLDVTYLLSSGEYLDFVMPQLYYGFYNESKPYIETLKMWNNLIKKNTKLYTALSIYKSGLLDTYAGSGKSEWEDNDDIIKKQIIISRNVNNYDGFAIFRYDYLFDNQENEVLTKEISNLHLLLE